MCTHRVNADTPGAVTLGEPLQLESGATLDNVEVAYRTWGRLSAAADNAVVICHALTGSADADVWWGDLIGPGKSLDPDRDFIICSNVLGSCYGTTGPASPRPGAVSSWGADFPTISVRDMVAVQRRLLDELGVRRIRLVIGGSLGGMQTLEWAIQDDRVASAVVIAASARHSAWCIAQSEAQRAAITADPSWCDGRYRPESPPAAGLSAARMIAMCSYRTPASFEDRFGRAACPGGDFEISDWLRYHGGALVDRFDANSYVTLTRAMDRHDVGRGRGGIETALGSVGIPVLVVSIDSDGLYTPTEQRQIAALIPGSELYTISSPHGHDAFLIETAELDGRARRFRSEVESTNLVALCAGGAA